MINGIINVYKEKGYTSHDVVAKLRGILRQKKIGHTGTLDPDAVGVLPVCLGNATKLCDMLTDKDKTYEAVLLLGTTTDTQDTSGTVLTEAIVTSSKDEITKVIEGFIGDYDQLPPMYSAIKVNGKRLYELAREGIEIDRKTRRVSIHNIQIHEIDLELKEVRITVACSKGTYIRTLCHDIGQKLQCGGCMKSLIRVKVGQFDLSHSLTIEQIKNMNDNNSLDEQITKVDSMFSNYDKVIMDKEHCKYLYNGNTFTIDQCVTRKGDINTTSVRVYDWQDNFVAIYSYHIEEKVFKPVKMFF